MPTQSDLEIRRFDEWAKTYDRSFLQRLFFGPIHSRVLDICNSSAAPPASVLDVGCGTGRLLYLAATQWPASSVLGKPTSKARAIVGLRRMRTVTSVTTPSSPSEPVMTPSKS